MADLVLPLRAVMMQLLLLIVSVAIEGVILQRQLGMSPRGSMQYSLALNLFSSAVGWLVAFTVHPLLPLPWQLDTISFVFFGHPFSTGSFGLTLPVFFGFAAYFFTFLVESQFMAILLKLWASPNPVFQYSTTETQYNRTQRYRQSWTARLRLNALFVANGASFAVIFLMLLVLSTSPTK